MAKTKIDPLSVITAKKGDLEREFPAALWEHMGPSKQGWEEIKADPAELSNVKHINANTGTATGATGGNQSQAGAAGNVVKELADTQKKRANTLAINKGNPAPYPELLPKEETKSGTATGATGDQRTPEQIAADLANQNTGGTGNE